MKKKGLKRMSVDLLEKVEKVKEFDIPQRLTVTELARKKEWKDLLKEKSVLEIMERNETIGVLVERKAFKGIQDYIRELESEIEELLEERELHSLKAMVDTRNDEYLEGMELEAAAIKQLLQQSKEM